MACPKCGGGLVLRGSMARGRYVCLNCEPEPSAGGAKLLQRYQSEVHGWHRSWCAALGIRALQGGGRTNPKDCDCGHTEPCPYTSQQIEQRERAAYGEAP